MHVDVAEYYRPNAMFAEAIKLRQNIFGSQGPVVAVVFTFKRAVYHFFRQRRNLAPVRASFIYLFTFFFARARETDRH